MFAFIVPFKPKRNSKNWYFDCYHLNNTLESLLHQTNQDFQVFVIFHEEPINKIRNSKITYLIFPYQYCEFDEITDREGALRDNSYLTKKDVEYLFDQGRKQLFGAQFAKDNGYEFIMCIDADDYVSKNLVAFVDSHKKINNVGWFVNKGYYYLLKQKVFLRQPYSMNTICGSTHILHNDLIPTVDFGNLKLGAHNFFSNHGYLTTLIKTEYAKELKPLPFYAIIYTITEINWSMTASKLKGGSFYYKIKYLIRRVLFSGAIRKRFYICN
jgi:hypothetical protein